MATQPESATQNGTGMASPGGTAVLGGSAGLRGNAGLRQQLQQLLQGLEQHVPADSTLAAIAGTSASGLSQAEVASQLSSWVTLFAVVNAQQHALAAARQQLNAALPAMRPYFAGVKAALLAAFGSDPAMLAEFGLQQRKVPPKPSAAELAVRAAKAAKTRDLRGTKSAKARQALKFTGSLSLQTVAAAAPGGTAPAAAVATTEAAIHPSG